jgi:uncharacterized protein (TIGR00661 family)
MMKILYGVQGTGNGHISRARMMAKYLIEAQKQNKVEVTFLFSGRKPDQYFEMNCFGDYMVRTGLSFATKDGEIDYLKSALTNKPFHFIYDILNLDLSPYDLVITDFEPVTAWAAKLKGKPVIGIGHQYAFKHNIPSAGNTPFAEMILKRFAPANVNIGLHWHHFGQNILPPIIDNELTVEKDSGKVLVYLPFENQQHVTEVLNNIKNFEFIQYSPELSEQQVGNVSHRKTCHTSFKATLASCHAVICNAGFELVSECLNLGRPIMAKALQGQMEQQSNAEALRQLGYAKTVTQLNHEYIQQWLESEQVAPKVKFPDVAKCLVEWICNLDLQQQGALKDLRTDLLTEQLWQTPLANT